MSADGITYRQQYSFCRKPNCRKCQAGVGHGPYWYAYQVVENRTVRTYIGKTLPPGVQATSIQIPDITPEQSASTQIALSSTTSQPETPIFRLLTLGMVRLEKRGPDGNWRAVKSPNWHLPQTRALLGCLLCAPERTLSFQKGGELLWPDLDAKNATRNLRRTGIILEELLGPLYRKHAEHAILTDQSQIWSDCDAFEDLLNQADALPGEQKSRRKALLIEANQLYGGDFFPEETMASWPRQRRDNLRARWITATLDLVDLHMDEQQARPALDLLNHLLANVPENEAAVQRLMFLLAQQQRRIEAVQAYRRLAALLQQTTQATPSPETQALFSMIQQGEMTLVRPLAAANNHLGQTDRAEEEAVMRPQLGDGSHPHTREATLHEHNQRQSDEIMASDELQNHILLGRTHQSPLVGRERQIELLSHLLTQVEPGKIALTHESAEQQKMRQGMRAAPHAQCVVLMGDTGIGKTRLAEECAREAQRRGWNVIWNHAYSQDQGPYRLWTTALRGVLAEAPGLAWQAISSAPIELYLPLRALMPDIQDLLNNAPDQIEAEIIAADMPLLPQEELRLRAAIHSFFTMLSLTAPLLLVLDDIQWADERSCQMLGYLTRRMSGYPMVILATCRANDPTDMRVLNQLIASMQREQVIEVVPIKPLNKEQIRKIVAYLPDTAITRIQNQVEGNPFFAEELANALWANTMTPGRNPYMNALLEDSQPLPNTIAAALNTRLDQLSHECKEMLSKAAVLGRSFNLDLITQMVSSKPTDNKDAVIQMGSSKTAGDEDTVIELLEEALNAGVLTEEGRGAHVTYHFWHPLLASHLYSSLRAGRRAVLHQKCATLLLQLHATHVEEEAATIAGHLLKGHAAPTKVAYYAEMAAHHAYNLFAFADAERSYRLALDQLESSLLAPLSDAPIDQAPLPGATLEQRLHLAFLIERLAECTRVHGNFQDAPTFYLRAIQLRSLPARTFATEEEARLEAQIQAILWSEIAWIWRFTGDTAAAHDCNERGEKVLRAAGINDGPAWGCLRHQQASLYWHEGLHQEAVQASHQALDLFTACLAKTTPDNTSQQNLPIEMQTRTMRTLRGDPVDLGRAHGFLGVIYNAIGQLSEGLSHLQQALAIHTQYDRRRDVAHVSCNIGHIHLLQGEYAKAKEVFLAQQDYVEQSGDILKSVLLYNLGELAAATQQFDEAEKLYRAGLSIVEVANDREYISMWSTILGNLLQRQGRFKEAAAAIRRGLAIGLAVPRNQPCIGVALTALANLRCSLVEYEHAGQSARGQFALRHAEVDIERALNLRGLDAEQRTRAKLAQARISYLLGKHSLARQQALQAKSDAQAYELHVLAAHCQQLLETIAEE